MTLVSPRRRIGRTTPHPGHRRGRGGIQAAGFIGPAVIIFGLFYAYPIINTLFISLHDWDIFGGNHEWVGVGNYTRALSDPAFWSSLGKTFYYFISVPIRIGLGLLLAYGLTTFDRWPIAQRFLRAVYFLPVITSWIVVSVIWKGILQPSGLLNQVIGSLGGPRLLWLADRSLAMPAIILMTIWKAVGFSMVVYSAALLAIDPELEEAAAIDGASNWQIFRRIKIPLLRRTTTFLFVISTIDAMQFFAQAYVLTNGGGPARATYPVMLYVYEQAFRRFDAGYASAMAYLLFLIILSITFVFNRINKRNEI